MQLLQAQKRKGINIMLSEPYNEESERCIKSSVPCMYHRYHVVHICGCGKLHSHSQGDCDAHRLHKIGIDIPSEYYYHGDTADMLFNRLQIYGLLPYGTKGLENVYDFMADTEKK